MPAALSAGASARREILELAADAIARRGFHGMSMRDLARAAGRSPARFYNHFGSKEEVLFRLQEGAFRALIAAAEGASNAAGREPAARLYGFVLSHVRYVHLHPTVMRVLVHEAAGLSPERRATVRELKEAYFERARALLNAVLVVEGVPVGALELERATYGLFGMLNWLYAWSLPSRHGPPHEVARSILSMALGGLAERRPDPVRLAEIEAALADLETPSLIMPASGSEGGSDDR